ncbi:MAG: PAS domain-containing protein [Desulfotomaculales bacterium]
MPAGGHVVLRHGTLVVQGNSLRLVDPAVGEVTGFSPVELRAAFWEERVHPEDRPRLRERLADCLAGREPPGPVSLRLLSREGGSVAVEADLSRVELDGEPAVLLHLRVGPQAGAEDYARLFAAVSDLVLTHDAERRILTVNPAAERVTGRPPAAWLGRPLAEMLAPDVRPLFADCAVPAEILLRPGPLTPLEMGLVRQHPAQTVEIPKDTPLPPCVLVAVAQHHERLDGSGYPAGLKGPEADPGPFLSGPRLGLPRLSCFVRVRPPVTFCLRRKYYSGQRGRVL